jgi:crossover junction endodeoxyribonuclease RuvC
MAQRLQQIYLGIEQVLQMYQPTEAAIEQVFLAKNASSALKLGHARGAAMTVMALRGIAITEYSTRFIKKAIVGYGGAEKAQIQQMIKYLLQLNDVPQVDAADALAVAVCHAHHRSSRYVQLTEEKEMA